MNYVERAVTFACRGQHLHGILALPDSSVSEGVLVVVGGPQYRVGSHRQFTLLSRDLAAAGIPVFRFDYAGMGDSEGAARTFEDVNEDIHAAIDAFMQNAPGLSRVALWGLCDGASASVFYACTDERVGAMVLLNPWVRTEQGMAKTLLKRYYLRRLIEPAFWRKIFSGGFDYASAIQSLVTNVRKLADHQPQTTGSMDQPADMPPASSTPLPERMLEGLNRFKGRVLIILSGKDLTAQEFEVTVNSDARWRKCMSAANVITRKLPGADHTFSRREWRNQISTWTREWLTSW